MAKEEFVVAEVDLVRLLGTNDELLRALESEFPEVKIVTRGDRFSIEGEVGAAARARLVVEELVKLVQLGATPSARTVREAKRIADAAPGFSPSQMLGETVIITPGKIVRPKTRGQFDYLAAIDEHTVCFGIGPAGTGKTYLAVAKAVAALYDKSVSRIILTRPAVEAGERLGFLPGTLSEKIDPYLRPLFDAIQEMLEPEVTQRMLANGVIEVAPLAYMRGRTLNDAFVILDEAQNTTPEQMKMFLTRLGFNSKMVVTGDITQVDLPSGKSGLDHASRVLAAVSGLHIVRLSSADVVRHELVTRIVEAYEEAQQ
jgi:phosphate starvation-inducible PhoH-like protein